jgi:hypothetical protein
MASTDSTRSTEPEDTADSGIEACRGALPSLPCATVRPPCSLIAFRPMVPSPPPPESTTPMARSPRSSAREAKRMSIGFCSRRPLPSS